MTKRKFNNNCIPTYVTKAVNYTAVAGDNIIVTANNLVITLPSSPTLADSISIINGAAFWIYVSISSPDKIMGSDNDRIILLGEIISKVDLYYKDVTIGWICREDYKKDRTGFVKVAGSYSANASLAIALDGSGWSWGYGGEGQLGNNTISSQSSPISILGGISWSQLIGGETHALGINGSDGSCWSWGANNYGQLGDRTITNKSSPVSVYGGMSFSHIAASKLNSIGIDATTGFAWVWGYGEFGQWGNNTTSTGGKSSPVSVLGGMSFTRVCAGGYFCTAIKSDGTGWGWGLNTAGQLGDTTITNKSSPVSIYGGMSFSHLWSCTGRTFGIDGSNGTGWAWGANNYAQFGDNTNLNSKSSPVSIVGGMSFTSITSGLYRTLAINGADGSAWGWGSQNSEIGDGTTSYRSSPVSVLGRISYSQLYGGNTHSLGIEGSNNVCWSWGSNSNGQLGNNTSANSKSSPILIVG